MEPQTAPPGQSRCTSALQARSTTPNLIARRRTRGATGLLGGTIPETRGRVWSKLDLEGRLKPTLDRGAPARRPVIPPKTSLRTQTNVNRPPSPCVLELAHQGPGEPKGLPCCGEDMSQGHESTPSAHSNAKVPRRLERSPTVHQRKKGGAGPRSAWQPLQRPAPRPAPAWQPTKSSVPQLSSQTNGRQATTNRNPRPPINEGPA